MTKILASLAIIFALVFTPAAFAAGLSSCPLHEYSSICYATGQVKFTEGGRMLNGYHCSCGDNWWIAD